MVHATGPNQEDEFKKKAYKALNTKLGTFFFNNEYIFRLRKEITHIKKILNLKKYYKAYKQK